AALASQREDLNKTRENQAYETSSNPHQRVQQRVQIMECDYSYSLEPGQRQQDDQRPLTSEELAERMTQTSVAVAFQEAALKQMKANPSYATSEDLQRTALGVEDDLIVKKRLLFHMIQLQTDPESDISGAPELLPPADRPALTNAEIIDRINRLQVVVARDEEALNRMKADLTHTTSPNLQKNKKAQDDLMVKKRVLDMMQTNSRTHQLICSSTGPYQRHQCNQRPLTSEEELGQRTNALRMAIAGREAALNKMKSDPTYETSADLQKTVQKVGDDLIIKKRFLDQMISSQTNSQNSSPRILEPGQHHLEGNVQPEQLVSGGLLVEDRRPLNLTSAEIAEHRDEVRVAVDEL
ncbi:hypothetical protein BKA70DRAFT_1312480, partial [Coprinopsis sp. MPI-PUGE-AT-0042]